MHVLLVGLGNMGRKYLKKLTELNLSPVLCDADPSKAELCQECPFYCHAGDVREELGAVIVAVKPEDHAKLAEEFLSKGVPVLLEKPPALSSEEFLPLLESPLLTVSEIELYSVPVKAFPRDFKPKEVLIERLNRGRGYINPLWDLAWHDLYLLQHLLGEPKVEEVKRDGDLWELKGEAGGVPFTMRVAWNYRGEQRRRWTLKGEETLLMDLGKEELYLGGRLLAKRERGDKLYEMVKEFVEGKGRPESRRRAFKNLKILEEIDAPRG